MNSVTPEHVRTSADLIGALWDQYGIFALGWIFCILEAGYIMYLHQKNSSIYREALEFARSATSSLLPVLSKNTEAVTTMINRVDEIAEDTSGIRTALLPGLGKLDLILNNFVMKRQSRPRDGATPDTK